MLAGGSMIFFGKKMRRLQNVFVTLRQRKTLSNRSLELWINWTLITKGVTGDIGE